MSMTKAIKDPKVDDDILKRVKGANDSPMGPMGNNVAARDFMNTYGKQYGLTNDQIGWYRNDPKSNGMITLGGKDLMAPDQLIDGKSYVDNEKLRTAIDQHYGAQKQQQAAPAFNNDLSAHGYKQDQYSAKIDGILNSILNQKPFQFDPNTDQSFQAYQQQFNRAGDRALANTMSEASAMTGGRLNSWAVSAGQGAKAQYDQQLMDVIPQLEQAAYARYQADIANQRANLGMVSDLDARAYGRAMDQRNFNYGTHRDGIADARYADETKYGRGRDAVADAQYNQQFNYTQKRDAIGDKRYQDEWNYGVNRDKVQDARYADETQYNRGQDSINRQDRLREAAIDNARQNASLGLQREQFNWNKEQDKIKNQMTKEQWDYEKKQLDSASKKVEDPELLAETYSMMKSGKLVDSSGRVVASGLTQSEWLAQIGKMGLPDDVFQSLRKIANEETELSYKDPMYMMNSMGSKSTKNNAGSRGWFNKKVD